MKTVSLIITAFIFIMQNTFAQQQGDFISGAEFEDISYNTDEILNYPKDKLPEGADKIFIRVFGEEQIAQLVFKFDYDYKLMPTITIDFPFNEAKKLAPEYKNGLIYVSSQMPFSSTIVTGIFKITKGDQLSFVGKQD